MNFFIKTLDKLKKSGIIFNVVNTQRNGVTVARQTLTLFVGVRIPIPQPIKKSTKHFGWCFILLFVIVQGFEQGGSEEVRKQFRELFLPTWVTALWHAVPFGKQ